MEIRTYQLVDISKLMGKSKRDMYLRKTLTDSSVSTLQPEMERVYVSVLS